MGVGVSRGSSEVGGGEEVEKGLEWSLLVWGGVYDGEWMVGI